LPELALHFSVVFAISAHKIGVRRALLLSLLALFPDLDVLIRVHRSISHSIVFLVLVCAPLLLAVYRFKPGYFRLALLGSLAVLSHPVMDCFQTYTPVLYPLLDQMVWVKVDGGVHVSSDGLAPQASVTIKGEPATFQPFETMDAPVFSSNSFVISLILVAVPIILDLKKIFYSEMEQATEPKTSSSEPVLNSEDPSAWLGLTLFIVGLHGITLGTISLLLKRMERRIIQTK